MSTAGQYRTGVRGNEASQSRFQQLRLAAPSLLALLGCFLLLGAALGGVFRVRHVTVIGANLPTDTIVQAAAVTGQNIFTVRSDQIIARLASVREIEVSKVDTSFPDGVTIYASLRQAAVAWHTGSALYEVDQAGAVIRQVTTTTVPIIQGADAHGQIGPGMVEAVLYAQQVLPKVANGAIASFQVTPQNGFEIVGKTGWTAIVGEGAPQLMATRVSTLVEILKKAPLHTGQLRLVDLRPSQPFARFIGS